MTTLYYTPLSQPSQALRTVLDLSGCEYEKVVIDLFKGENKGEELTALNRMQQVPFLKEGDVVMNESSSIMRYIAEKHQLRDVYPEDFVARHRVDSALDFSGATLRRGLWKALVHIGIRPAFFGAPAPSEEKAAELMATANETLEKLTLQLEANYVAGDTFSIADIQCFFEVALFKLTLQFDLIAYPVVDAWFT